MASKPCDDDLSCADVVVRSEHLVSERRHESLERLSNEHELVIVSERRAGQLSTSAYIALLSLYSLAAATKKTEKLHGVDAGLGPV